MQSVYRSSRRINSETEPLISVEPVATSSSQSDYGSSINYDNAANNGAMAELGVSQSQLVAPPGDNGRKLPQYIAALAATLGALAAGTMLGWSSPVMVEIVKENNTDYSFPISDFQGDWISSLTTLGAAGVCFPIGLVMDSIGRRTTMLLLVIPFFIGWVLIAMAQNVAMLMVGRFVTGIAGGAFCVTAPSYTSEIAQDSIRGTLGSYFQLMVTIGILFAYSVGSYTSVLTFNWLCACIPLVFGAVFFFMPESPKFLASKGRNEEARSALVKLRGAEYDVDGELNALREAAEEAKRTPVALSAALAKKTTIKVLIICYALMVFQQLSGINAVIFNTSAIFESAGVETPAAIATIIIGVIQVVATFVSSLIVDRLGRRILLLFSALLMCLCTTALGVYFFLKDVHGADSSIVLSMSWLPLLSLSLFIVAFSMGFGPIPWMMAGDLCPLEVKAFVSSTAGTLNWLLAFTVTQTFNTLKRAMGDGQVFWLFSAIMLVGFIFIFLVVPETKGKSIEEMQYILGGERPNRTEEDKK